MIAVGIDPGTRNLGWGVVERRGTSLVHVAHGVLRVGGDDELAVRLERLFSGLETVFTEHRPQVGAVEEMFFDKNAQSAAKLGHARGVVLLALQRQQIAVREHTPGRVKRSLTGHGHADKAQVAHMVRAILKLEALPPADAADALALAITELRLDPRAHALEQQKRARGRQRSLPPHLARAIEEAREKRQKAK